MQTGLQGKAQGAVTEGKAKSVIQLWMWGGPSHLDTVDPKPEAGEAYCGELKNPIETKAPGMRISQLFPLLAKQGDKFSILRSFTSLTDDHDGGTYTVQTGFPTSQQFGAGCGQATRQPVHRRGRGSEEGLRGGLPRGLAAVYHPPQERLVDRRLQGFLGPRYEPFATGGDPNQPGFMAQGMRLANGITPQRLEARHALLHDVDSLARQIDKDKLFQAMDSFQEKAYGLVLGDAKKAFDLSQENDKLRDRYGRNTFGQSCLLARRLVEHGVPFVTVVDGGWDMHNTCIEFDETKVAEHRRGIRRPA